MCDKEFEEILDQAVDELAVLRAKVEHDHLKTFAEIEKQEDWYAAMLLKIEKDTEEHDKALALLRAKMETLKITPTPMTPQETSENAENMELNN